ncbi:hypothetical protein BJ742DRAFT_745989 [Cladochytrium replicatum]|nr:hypothetical protein BJ742DRAFT_745989 [Cladochytrium replicatum]
MDQKYALTITLAVFIIDTSVVGGPEEYSMIFNASIPFLEVALSRVLHIISIDIVPTETTGDFQSVRYTSMEHPMHAMYAPPYPNMHMHHSHHPHNPYEIPSGPPHRPHQMLSTVGLPPMGVQSVSPGGTITTMTSASTSSNTSPSDEPLYVNAKQYHRIIKRREARGQSGNNRTGTAARRRPRGPGGRFLSAAELAAMEKQNRIAEAAPAASDAAGSDTATHKASTSSVMPPLRRVDYGRVVPVYPVPVRQS